MLFLKGYIYALDEWKFEKNFFLREGTSYFLTPVVRGIAFHVPVIEKLIVHSRDAELKSGRFLYRHDLADPLRTDPYTPLFKKGMHMPEYDEQLHQGRRA